MYMRPPASLASPPPRPRPTSAPSCTLPGRGEWATALGRAPARPVSACAPSAGQPENLQRHRSAKAHLRPGRRAARFIRPSGHEGRLPEGSRISTFGNGDSKRALQPRPGPSETITFWNPNAMFHIPRVNHGSYPERGAITFLPQL